MIELLKKLIAIESISGDEKRITDFVESLLVDVEGNVERTGNVLIWKNDWVADRQTIALGAHLDTVPFTASDWQVTQPCEPIEKEGKIYGRGACDMKAGAAIILDIILSKKWGDQYNVMVFLYDKEELGIPNGVTKMMDRGDFANVDLCIIPEPTSCKVNYGVFGNLDAKIIGHGVAVHSSNPRLGRNAIYELIPVLEQIRDYPLATIDGVQEAMSVNIIQGGKAINVVPDHVVAQMDYRFDPRISEEEVMTRLKTFERAHVSTSPIGCFPGVIHDPSQHPLLRQLMEIAGGGFVVPFWSDIGQLGTADIVAVNFGPGSIQQAHTADEYVEIEEVIKVSHILEQFLNGEHL